MVTFISILFIIFGILQIILFFKVWGMTNDVRKLTDKLCGNQIEETPQVISEEYAAEQEYTEPDDSELSVGDLVIRRKDGKVMIIDRIVCGKYGCAEPKTKVFIDGYSREEICLKNNKN